MNSGRDRMRMNAEGDRLSALQDDLILKILCFIGLKDAIKTSVLSSRWRFMWTSISHLSFSTEDFRMLPKLYDFIIHVLSRRDNQVQLSSFKLYLRVIYDHDVAQRIVNHAFSLNVPQVNITCVCGDNMYSMLKQRSTFPLSLSSSKTLKHLTLSGSYAYDYITLTSTGTGEFSSLATLHLDLITLYDGFFSKCPNLENLTLSSCMIAGSEVLRVCHPRLSNLTLENTNIGVRTVNVVTPQLKNLTVGQYRSRYIISAPKLASLIIRGLSPFMFSTDGFPSLEKAHLSLHCLSGLDGSTVISLLREFYNVKVLSLSEPIIQSILQFLNYSIELIAHQPSPLANLKRLKILPVNYCRWDKPYETVIMSTEVRNYMLNRYPKATLTKVL